MLAAICYADDVVLVAASIGCCGSDSGRGYCKIERGRSACWCTENTLDEPPKDGRQKHCGRRIGCAGIGRIEGVFGRECRMCDCTQICSSQQPVLNSSWLPRMLRLNIVKRTMWHAFLWSSSVWTTVKAQRDQIASWSARMVANVIGVKKPPWVEMDQWWRLWHRTGHRWIEKCNMNVLSAIRERALSWAWCVVHFNGGDGDSSTGKKWRRTNGLARTHSVSKSTGGRTWWRQSSLEMQTVFRNQFRNPRVGCILLKRNWERALAGRSQMPRGPKCVRHAGGTHNAVGVDWCYKGFVASSGSVWCRKLVLASNLDD